MITSVWDEISTQTVQYANTIALQYSILVVYKPLVIPKSPIVTAGNNATIISIITKVWFLFARKNYKACFNQHIFAVQL